MSIDNAANCYNYIKNYVDDTPCRKKILELTEWIFSLGTTVKWYTRENGKSVAFFLRTQGHDHFAIFKLQKKCTQMDLYVRLNKQVILPSYLIRYEDNQDWARIAGKNFSSLSKEDLQGHILNSYNLRRGELDIYIKPNSIPSVIPPKEKNHELTLTEIEILLRNYPKEGSSE